MKYRYDLINFLIAKYNYTNYLEIGVGKGLCIEKVICQNKTAVDPRSKHKDVTHKTTSDLFFQEIDKNIKYDVIFIDGLHISEQVDKDIINSIKHLSTGGHILIHDCKPLVKDNAGTVPVKGVGWTGDTYKSIAKLDMLYTGLKYNTVDIDWGVAVLQPQKNFKIKEKTKQLPVIDWNYFIQYSSTFLKLINVNQFKELF